VPRLTDELRLQIIERLRCGEPEAAVAAQFGFSIGTIGKVASEAATPNAKSQGPRAKSQEQRGNGRTLVLAAVEGGDERCITTLSTALGTRHPIIGYVAE
jgi:hypothetical protein